MSERIKIIREYIRYIIINYNQNRLILLLVRPSASPKLFNHYHHLFTYINKSQNSLKIAVLILSYQF